MRLTLRPGFFGGERQLEVNFYTSNIAKFLQARLICERCGLRLRHFRSRTDPYSEEYELGKEELLRRAISEVAAHVAADSIFFVEDTSLRVAALSTDDRDFPGLAVKEWFPSITFEGLDAELVKRGNDRRVVVKSDIALRLPGYPQPVFFHGETPGVVADAPSTQTQSHRYPWLGPDSFNAWFVPEGAVRRLSEMEFDASISYDFRAKALLTLVDRLEEYTAVLNLPPAGYRRSTKPTDAAQPSLFDAARPSRLPLPSRPFVVVGRTCAGKTTLAEYAVIHHGFKHVEASAIVRMFSRAGQSNGLGALASAQQLLAERGADFVAREILRMYEPDLADGLIVTGFRTIEELLTICETVEGTLIVWVEASERTRFERHLARERYQDAATLEAFKAFDEGQMSLGLLRVAQDLADVIIENEDSIEEYQRRVGALVVGGGSGVTGLRRLPSFAVRRRRSQLFRILRALVGQLPLTCREVSEQTVTEGRPIATRNVNEVLKHVPELARRYRPPGEEIRYEVTSAGIAYVRFMEQRKDIQAGTLAAADSVPDSFNEGQR